MRPVGLVRASNGETRSESTSFATVLYLIQARHKQTAAEEKSSIMVNVMVKPGSAIIYKEFDNLTRCVDCEKTFTAGAGGVKRCECDGETYASRKTARRVEASYLLDVNFSCSSFTNFSCSSLNACHTRTAAIRSRARDCCVLAALNCGMRRRKSGSNPVCGLSAW